MVIEKSSEGPGLSVFQVVIKASVWAVIFAEKHSEKSMQRALIIVDIVENLKLQDIGG